MPDLDELKAAYLDALHEMNEANEALLPHLTTAEIQAGEPIPVMSPESADAHKTFGKAWTKYEKARDAYWTAFDASK